MYYVFCGIGSDVGDRQPAGAGRCRQIKVKLGVEGGTKPQRDIREYDIYLFEESVFADEIIGLAKFKRGTDIPLDTGEHEYIKFSVRDLVINNAVDIV